MWGVAGGPGQIFDFDGQALHFYFYSLFDFV
jgi:hypothetical protein